MLKVLAAKPSSPPTNALAANPRIAELISLYFECGNRGCLPDEGGLLDQRADLMAFFAIFDNARALHSEVTRGSR